MYCCFLVVVICYFLELACVGGVVGVVVVVVVVGVVVVVVGVGVGVSMRAGAARR
jgi:hypothetical protein